MEDEFANRCEHVLREQAKEVLADGRAIEGIEGEEGDWLKLTPTRESGCPMSATPNGPGAGELSIGVGRNDAWFEVWGSADETVEFLRNAIEAVTAGRYEEFVKGRKVIGRLLLPDGPFVFRQNTFLAQWPQKFGRWSHASYEPY